MNVWSMKDSNYYIHEAIWSIFPSFITTNVKLILKQKDIKYIKFTRKYTNETLINLSMFPQQNSYLILLTPKELNVIL